MGDVCRCLVARQRPTLRGRGPPEALDHEEGSVPRLEAHVGGRRLFHEYETSCHDAYDLDHGEDSHSSMPPSETLPGRCRAALAQLGVTFDRTKFEYRSN